MIHKIKLKNKNNVRDWSGDDIGEMALTVCAAMLGMHIDNIRLYINGEKLKISRADIGIIRNEIIKKMKHQEKQVDFEINDLFEI